MRSSTTPLVIQIHNRPQHDKIVEESKQTPTVIHVSNSALPACRTFSPKFEQMAQKHQSTGVRFTEMDYDTETSYLFKFSPNQLPVTVFMIGDRWAKTVMGPSAAEIEMAIGMLVEETAKESEK